MTKQVEMLTNEQLQAQVNCSPATVTRWIKRGIPCHREATGRGGAKRLLFPREDALRWILENASMTAAQMAMALTKKPEGQPEPEPTAAPVDPNTVDDEGLIPCLERLRKTEKESYALLQKLKRAGDIGGVRVVGERFVNECRALVALERAAVDYQTRKGELVDFAGARAVYMRVVTAIKNNVMGVPSSAVPLLLQFIRDPEDGRKVFAVLDKLVRDALRSIRDPDTGRLAQPQAAATEGTKAGPTS